MVNGEKERVSLLVMKKLASRGNVDAVSQQMASHPQYLESFLRTQHYILHMDGPLPLPYRHYIAIMVSDRAAVPGARWRRARWSENLFFKLRFRPPHDITATTWCTCTRLSSWGWAGTLSGCMVWKQHPLAFAFSTISTRCWPTNPGSPPAPISRYDEVVKKSKCFCVLFLFVELKGASLCLADSAEGRRTVLVSGRAGAGRGDPGPLPLPLQLCVWMQHRLQLCSSCQISQRYPADLLSLWCCQRQHQRASVSCCALWTHSTTTGKQTWLFHVKILTSRENRKTNVSLSLRQTWSGLFNTFDLTEPAFLEEALHLWRLSLRVSVHLGSL